MKIYVKVKPAARADRIEKTGDNQFSAQKIFEIKEPEK